MSGRTVKPLGPVGVTGPEDGLNGARPVVGAAEPDWIIEKHFRVLQRKTYIRGILIAKFYGEHDSIKDLQQFVYEQYFDISLYDAQIVDAEFRKNNDGPFPESDEVFIGAIEPNPLPCSVSYQGVTWRYSVQLHDVRTSNIDLNKYRLLHMKEDDLVFGTLEATITGYMSEYFREEFEVRVPVAKPTGKEAGTVGAVPNGGADHGALSGMAHSGWRRPAGDRVETGNTITKNGYRWREFLDARRDSTAWGDPVYAGKERGGCLGSAGWIVMAFIGVMFLLAIGPQGAMVLLGLAAFGLVVGFFSGLFRPILWLFTGLFFLVGLAALVGRFVCGPEVLNVPFSGDQASEVTFVVRESTVGTDSRAAARSNVDTSMVDSSSTAGAIDSVIVHHRVWKDYADSVYEGDISISTSDMARSTAFKNQLRPHGEPLVSYDRMLGALAGSDSAFLPGVYRLFDSIRVRHHPDTTGFAEIVVSFVQDIPYALVLDGDCDPNLYSDGFTQKYLQSPGAVCAGFQRFGIHTPVEFMGTLQGDCDTRTLLLYTLLDHYGYDVAILSSEVYSHSLLGIDLPVAGTAYACRGKRYVLWETTTPGIPPGLIPAQLSNLSNWRISIKSKN
ncbi:MAG TPA: hypothetical protein VG605_13620 [Puia sp.]|nr:hypothetical protein [Puia sp.]